MFFSILMDDDIWIETNLFSHMSYADPSCRNYFSTSQLEYMSDVWQWRVHGTSKKYLMPSVALWPNPFSPGQGQQQKVKVILPYPFHRNVTTDYIPSGLAFEIMNMQGGAIVQSKHISDFDLKTDPEGNFILSFTWQGKNSAGTPLTPGYYFITVSIDPKAAIRPNLNRSAATKVVIQ